MRFRGDFVRISRYTTHEIVTSLMVRRKTTILDRSIYSYNGISGIGIHGYMGIQIVQVHNHRKNAHSRNMLSGLSRSNIVCEVRTGM